MPSDELFTPPRKKIRIFWWLGGIFVLLGLVFVLQLFGPNPPIVISPQTTYIASPRGPDGLPDYEQYVLELYRDGVTIENNAAPLLLRALWPAELDPKDYATVVTELGLEEIPSKDEALVRVHDQSTMARIANWLHEQAKTQRSETAGADESVNGEAETGGDSFNVDDDPLVSIAADSVIEGSQSRPWTSEQIPPLAEWVAANQKPLDLIVEAAKRPRFFSPSPTLINNKQDLLIEMLLPNVQALRDAGRALSIRAMWHLGENRLDAAWQDVLALHRLARLLSQGYTLIEQLIAIAINEIACDATVSLLDHRELTPEQARLVQRDLAALPPFANVARSLDQMERAGALNAFIRVGTGGGGKMFSAISGVQDNDFGNNVFNVISVDWNLVLRETNRWYDRLAAAANLPDHAARMAALQQIDADMQQLVAEVRTPTTWITGVISRQQRSMLVSSIMLGLFLPTVNAAVAAEDRANGTLELTRLAAALAVYRAESGAYPDKLDELVPSVLEALPVDLYNAKPFVYKRDGDGYLLYTLGGNGTDDGGSNSQFRLRKGKPIDEMANAEAPSVDSTIPNGADDTSIRVPRPKFELPKLSPTPGEL
jgi:hypothetical protein